MLQKYVCLQKFHFSSPAHEARVTRTQRPLWLAVLALLLQSSIWLQVLSGEGGTD